MVIFQHCLWPLVKLTIFQVYNCVNRSLYVPILLLINDSLRVFLSILAYFWPLHFFWTDDARINPIFLLKHLTQKVYDDSLSDDTAPSSGSSELIKIETLNAIYFGHSNPIFIILLPFGCKFNELSQMEILILKCFVKKRFFLLKDGFKILNRMWNSWIRSRRDKQICFMESA